jgi:hypothetical protein
MRTARTLLQHFREVGMNVRSGGAKVIVKPASMLTPTLKAWILGVKPELLAVLAGDYTLAAFELLMREVTSFDQRYALAREFDAQVDPAGREEGLTRGEATRIAYKVLATHVESTLPHESRISRMEITT